MQQSSQYTPVTKLQQPGYLVLCHAQDKVRVMTVHNAMQKMSNFFSEGCGQQCVLNKRQSIQLCDKNHANN